MVAKPPVSLRKPPSPAAADAFVHGKRPGVQASKGRRSSRETIERSDGRELRRRTVYLPAALDKRLVIYCAETDRDLSDVVTEAVSRLLG